MSDKLAYRYRAGAPTKTGLPARDITVEEFARMTPDQRRAVRNLTDAYRPVGTKGRTSTPAADDAAKKEGE